MHTSFDGKISPLFRARSQGSGMAAIRRSRVGRRCAGIRGERSAMACTTPRMSIRIGGSEVEDKKGEGHTILTPKATSHRYILHYS